MDSSRHEIKPGVWLDCRRAVFLENEGVLAIADLHLGYAWAHRFNGQMLPLHNADFLIGRVSDLIQTYIPKRVVLLGDILHQAVPITAVEKDFSELVQLINASALLTLVRGNHDKKLATFIKKCQLPVQLEAQAESGDSLFIHGDIAPTNIEDFKLVLMGHEHPAISLGDGVSTSARFPCFLLSERVLVLPAFSLYAAGTSFRSHRFMSRLAQEARFELAVAIMGRRLLPVPIKN
jgi:putative SbcD/Mre11-related phosphoesterase